MTWLRGLIDRVRWQLELLSWRREAAQMAAFDECVVTLSDGSVVTVFQYDQGRSMVAAPNLSRTEFYETYVRPRLRRRMDERLQAWRMRSQIDR